MISVAIARKLRWIAPYLAIWLPVLVYAWETLRPACLEACALYSGFLMYAIVAVALLLTALVTVTELAVLATHHAHPHSS